MPLYPADEFERMLAEQHPGTVLVCTPDYLHDYYIIRSLEAGCEVISEKPLITNATEDDRS